MPQNKLILWAFVCVFIVGLLTADVASAEEYDLSPPEFTVSVVDNRLLLTIDDHGTDPSVGYNIRIKHHLDSEWTELYSGNEVLYQDAHSDFTKYGFEGVSQTGGSIKVGYPTVNFTFSGTVDFQVDRKRSVPVGRHTDPMGTWIYDISEGPWSYTKSYTFSVSPTPTPTPTPPGLVEPPVMTTPTSTLSGQDFPVTLKFDVDWVQIAILTLLVAIVVLLVVNIFLHLRRPSPPPP